MDDTSTDPPANPSPGRSALQGLKVLELGQLIAGPFAAQDAGRLRRRGDQDRAARRRRPAAQLAPAEGRHLGVVAGAVAQQALAGARPARRPRARTIVRKLVAEADVLIENFRPGALEGWGLALRRRCSRRNPRPRHAAHQRLRADRPVPRPARLRRRSARRWAGCATSPASRAACRCASASASATRWPRCTA